MLLIVLLIIVAIIFIMSYVTTQIVHVSPGSEFLSFVHMLLP